MIINTRWRKVFRDLWINQERSLLVILAISLGVFAVTVVSSSYAILTHTTDVNYLSTNPASATLWTDALDDNFVQEVRNLPDISEAEARRRARARFLIEDEWVTIWLFVINDFDDIRVSTFKPEEGAWPPATGEILIERNALKTYELGIDDRLVIQTPNGIQRELPIVGSVHDPGLEQAWMEGVAYGYITPDTYEWLGETPTLDQLNIVVAEDSLNKEHIVHTANQTRIWIEQNGRQVYRVKVPLPGEHPHRRPIGGFMFLMQALGLVSLVLSGVLVANMISALLAQQIRQIGVMKAVGAGTWQVMGIYYGTVLILGLAALMVAMPISILASRAYCVYAAGLMNFNLNWQIPVWVYALQVIVSLLVPLLVASYPVYRGSQVTVREAISDYGIGQDQFGKGPIDLLLGRIGGLVRPFLLSIRNTFRRHGRLVFTLSTLILGGAVFMATLNIRASIGKTLDEVYETPFFNNIDITLVRPYPTELIEQATHDIPGVARVETWNSALASVMYPDGTESNSFRVTAPPATTTLLDASNVSLMEGRWLQPDDENALVINHYFLSEDFGDASVTVGDEIVLKIDGQETTWEIVGIVRQVMVEATAYVNYASFIRATGREEGYTNSIRVVTEGRDAASQDAVLSLLEQELADSGLNVAWTMKSAEYGESIQDHMLLVTGFLLLMATLSIIVGGLGLMTTMSINVMERTREIGVMRAIGASTLDILQIVVTEGSLIGFLSWLVTPLLALPFSIIIGNAFGNLMLGTYLDFVFAPLGLGVWLGVIVIFSGIASFLPAWSATQMTVTEVLAYE